MVHKDMSHSIPHTKSSSVVRSTRTLNLNFDFIVDDSRNRVKRGGRHTYFRVKGRKY